MPSLNWGMVTDGGAFESLMHTILFAEDPTTVLFGRPGKDAGQDARSADGAVVYQAKYRQGLNMDSAIELALEELDKIRNYRQSSHPNHIHWQVAQRWVLVANLLINPNDDAKWRSQVVPVFQQEGLAADYWHIDILEGKLAQRPEVRDVFFGGENRVLVGLKEAHNLLSVECIGSLSLDIPMVGRDDELELINSFASSGDKRVLPVVGPSGIGKSRLLYEGLVSLAQDGWRVLWALPGTMARSSQWFRLLNGAQKTCVALDAPDDPGLLRAVIEQLATVERRNWRVIVAYRSEKAQALQRFKTHKHVHEQIRLTPLDEPNSHALVNACLQDTAQPSWLHSVYSFTNGVPGWLCLIGELVKRGKLHDLPLNADDVAALYVDSCLDELGDPNREQGRTLLRWLALWGTLRVESGSMRQAEYCFLETLGIPEGTARNLLRLFVNTGIVRNWGLGKRLFAIEPLIIRQQILSSWLFRENDGVYEVSHEGSELVNQIVKGNVPAADSVLNSLSQLARSRLVELEVFSFLKPVFNVMAKIVTGGSVRDQYIVADLVEKAGAADPESALDVLISIRENTKNSMVLNDPNWGNQTLTHEALLAISPLTLFWIAEHVSDPTVARRYINEFRQLIALEDLGSLNATNGKKPRELLKRILVGSSNVDVFAQPAHDLAVAGLSELADWPFVRILVECLLNPIRETVERVADRTITITSRPLTPGTSEWGMATDIREKAFAVLRNHTECEFRGPLWEVLAESHHAFHRAVLHGEVRDLVKIRYYEVLADDLKTCAAILVAPPVAMTIAEATYARKMWSWYLKYGREDDPVELARDCEKIYACLSTWRLHEFFSFETEEELATETTRIANLLLNATSPNVFIEFFEEAKRYLDASQPAQDMADHWLISSLVDIYPDRFVIDVNSPMNPLTTFTFGVLEQPESSNPLAWCFVIRVCQRHLFNAKTLDEATVDAALSELLKATRAQSRLLKDLYSTPRPLSTGVLTKVEFECVLEHETDFSILDWFFLLGPFYALDASLVQERLQSRLNVLSDDAVEPSNCMEKFIISTYYAALYYRWTAEQMPVGWIIDMITAYGLEGRLFGMHKLARMRDQSSFRLNMVRLRDFIRSRYELEQNAKPYDGFEIIPHNFDIGAWVVFDATQEAEVDAFRDFCNLVFGNAVYWIPKYVCQLDHSGQHVAAFVRQYFDETPDITADALARLGYLASEYENDSSQWATIAGPICKRAENLPREERERVYFGLSRKEIGLMTGMRGQVPDYYVRAHETAIRLRDAESLDSPLSDYREWALRRAEAEFKVEQGLAEEWADE